MQLALDVLPGSATYHVLRCGADATDNSHVAFASFGLPVSGICSGCVHFLPAAGSKTNLQKRAEVRKWISKKQLSEAFNNELVAVKLPKLMWCVPAEAGKEVSVPTPKSSFLALITLSLAAALVLALAFSVFLAGATLAFARGQETESFNAKAVSQQEFAGVITDQHCGARHPEGSGKSAAECAQACVKNGSRYALVNGDQIYVLRGNKATLDSVAGERVKVVGRLRGNTIAVNSVNAQ
jgi:hypothetical protein